MKILAIETSCDDTSIAILQAGDGKSPDFKILSNIISSQTKLHAKYGGVFPTLAKREHQRNLLPVLIKALEKSKLHKNLKSQIPHPKIQTINTILQREPDLAKKLISFLKTYCKPDVDIISVTNGPGLEPCLWVGINFARALSYFWGIQIVSVDHIESHILVNLLDNNIAFPAIALVVSGGHTQIILVKAIGKYKILGETLDDAAGECFDKCARILGLGYPGGPAIAAAVAKSHDPKSAPKLNNQAKLPRPMINSKDYNFSFSGLKTSVLYNFQSQFPKTRKNKKYIQAMAAEIQQSIIDVLIKKTIKSAKDYSAKTIILGGGVTANKELRKQFQERITKEIPNAKYLIPDTPYSTDNAAMSAITGYFRFKNGKSEKWQNIKADSNLRI